MIKHLRSPDGLRIASFDLSTASGKRSYEICVQNGYARYEESREESKQAEAEAEKARSTRLRAVVKELKALKAEFDASSPLEELEALLETKQAEAEAEKAKK